MADKYCTLHPEVPLALVDGSCRSCVKHLAPTADKNPPPEGGFLKRPLVEFTRTKKIETQLTRIANALEQLLIQQYGFFTDAPSTDTSGPEPQVMYTDHDEHDIQDILDDMKER